MKIYEENWTAKNREALIRRIKIKQKEIDQDIVIKMFEVGLEWKIEKKGPCRKWKWTK